ILPDNINESNHNNCIGCLSPEINQIDTVAYLCQCKKCELIFDTPQPLLDSIRDYYSQPQQYDHWLSQINEREKLWKRRIQTFRSCLVGSSILDIGAGIGQFLSLLEGIIPIREGTELSGRAFQIAREKYNINLYNGDISDIILDRKYDVITLFHVLEHVTKPFDLMLRCSELLNKNGILLVAVPNDQDSFRNKLKGFLSPFLKVYCPKRFKYLGHLGLPRIMSDISLHELHLSHWNFNSLEKCFTLNGFEIVEMKLDPYYVATGIKLIFEKNFYRTCQLIYHIFGYNGYDTCAVVLRKKNVI
ncbi:MAG: class I SAM-dependent methyltransferase, partial [Verrucomicrobiota bacterium]|nr:class I SAM-dependent methyltransferase [Verrucomicrobiota bacterium]